MKISELKILELASVLAGPQVGSFFAELGAKVIKVENKTTRGDVTRNWRLPSESDENSISAYYSSANTGKEILFINLKSDEGRSEIYELIKSCDIIISNFKPGDDLKFGLDYKSCKALNPKIIYGEITGFGKTTNRTAFDVILQAETGYISMNGTNADNLAKLPVAFIDLFAAHQLKEGLLLALLEKKFPSLVSVSLFDSAISALANQASNFLMENHIPKPMGTQHPNIAPYGDIFITKDLKPVTIAIGTERHFKRLLEVLGIEENERFDTNLKRVKNREELNKIIEPAISKLSRTEFLEEAIKSGIPAGGVYNLKEVFEQEAAKALVINETLEDEKVQKVKTVVFSISS